MFSAAPDPCLPSGHHKCHITERRCGPHEGVLLATLAFVCVFVCLISKGKQNQSDVLASCLYVLMERALNASRDLHGRVLVPVSNANRADGL